MNLKLEINYIASDVFQDKLSMMISTGDAFDLLCLMEDQKSFTSYVAMGALLPIDDYMEGMDALKHENSRFHLGQRHRGRKNLYHSGLLD